MGSIRLWLATAQLAARARELLPQRSRVPPGIWASALLVPLALCFGRTGVERVLLIGSYLVLLIVELLNTGIEVVVDRIGLERHAVGVRQGPRLGRRAAAPAAGGDHLVTRAIRLIPRPPARIHTNGSTMTALICGSMAYDTVMVFAGRFREHILPDRSTC